VCSFFLSRLSSDHEGVFLGSPDAGLLRFAESINRTDDLRARWIEAGKISFNSSTSYSSCPRYFSSLTGLQRTNSL
jgi:hypothetical protein